MVLMNVSEKSLIEHALYYSNYFPVYPLARNTVVPLAGSKGHLDATQDQEKIVEFFTEKAPDGNIGASFIGTDYFVLDVDNKVVGKDGLTSLNKILPKGESLGDPVVVKTKSGNGLHLYYKTTAEIKHKIDWLPNVDVLKNSCVMPPTKAPTTTGEIGEYVFVKGTLDDVTEPPQWLLNAIISSQKEADSSFTISYNTMPSTKKYTAILLEEIVQGVEESQRNVWLTKITGKLLKLGMNSSEAYEFILVANENFVRPPLPDKEVNTIFKSILKSELNKRKGAAT